MNKSLLPQFVHLRVRSSYSLLEGAIIPEKIASLCTDYRMKAVAITDNQNLFGALECAEYCVKSGIQPIMGCIMRVAHENTPLLPYDELVILAKNDIGYKNLISLSSKAFLEHVENTAPHITIECLKNYAEGLIVLTGGPKGRIGRLLLQQKSQEAEESLFELMRIFPDHLYIELMRHGLSEEEATEKSFIDLAYKHALPLVATNDVYFPHKDLYEAHDVLFCIAEGKVVSEEERRRCTPEHYFKNAEEMHTLFSDIPEALENTMIIAQRCSVMPEGRSPLFPRFAIEEGADEKEALRIASERGLKERFEQRSFAQTFKEDQKQALFETYQTQLHYELETILTTGFSGYFLIVSDFIRWSKAHDIPVGPGRGSGAGSVVAWTLGITDLPPLQFGLLFERFLNPERIDIPDFDIDFCRDRRNEVIRYVQEKYGHDHVAQIITFGKLQARAVLRDVGRVLEIPYGKVDRICKLVPFNPAHPVTLSEAIAIDSELQEARNSDSETEKLLDLGLKLEGLNRHASVHAAGLVISDRPLQDLIPLYRDPNSDMPVTQYSMKYVQKAGLVKFDFLGLKTLTMIEQACRLIRHAHPDCKDFSISDIILDDKLTYDLLSRGDAIGIFQLERESLREVLCTLKPDSFEDIIALGALIRPGPMDHIPTYIARKHGREKPDYMHPLLEPILKETFGVVIYQEQVMKVAQILAGYSLGQADILRRAMGKKIKKEMDTQREQFIDGAQKNGVNKDQASMLFDLLAKFASYGFNKSHAAAYGLISYQTAWLKAHYPLEFFVATLNLDIDDTEKICLFFRDAKRMNILLLPPDINMSKPYFSIEETKEGKRGIRYGLGGIKQVGIQAMELVMLERNHNGVFTSLWNFARRCSEKVLNKRQIEALSKAGAFDGLCSDRAVCFHMAEMLTLYHQRVQRERQSLQFSLFGAALEEKDEDMVLPKVHAWSVQEMLHNEQQVLGFYLSAHPLDSYVPLLKAIHIQEAREWEEGVCTLPDEEALSFGNKKATVTRAMVAGVVTQYKTKILPRGKCAFLQLSDPSGYFEICIFDESLLFAHREAFDQHIPLLMHIDIKKEGSSTRMIAQNIENLSHALARMTIHATIYLSNTEKLQELQSYLKKTVQEEYVGGYDRVGSSSIKIICPSTLNKNVEIQLPFYYTLCYEKIPNLHALPCVIHIDYFI